MSTHMPYSLFLRQWPIGRRATVEYQRIPPEFRIIARGRMGDSWESKQKELRRVRVLFAFSKSYPLGLAAGCWNTACCVGGFPPPVKRTAGLF